MVEGKSSQGAKRKQQRWGAHFLEKSEGGTDQEHRKGSEWVIGAHRLEIAEGQQVRICKDSNQAKENSLPGDGRVRDKSEHGKKATERGALTD